MKKSKIYRTDVHFGYEVPKYDTNDIFDKAITTEKLDDKAVTNEKMDEGAVDWKNLSGDVQNIIASREEGGVALSGDWGDSELIGITQKKLTEEHESVSDKLAKLNDKINFEAETRIVNDDTLRQRIEVAEGVLPNKVDKVEGKGLSTNDYDDIEKQRLADVREQLVSGGDIDLRISNAVSAETRRATEVEATKADKSDTYTKAEVNSLVTTPDQQYVTVETYGALPATGAANTIYRVANWDGTQVVSNVYSEYSWNGSGYVFLDKKEFGIDDEPTAGSENLVKSGGVAEEISVKKNEHFIDLTPWVSNGATRLTTGDIEIGSIVSLEFVSNNAWRTAKITVKKGDIIKIFGHGSSAFLLLETGEDGEVKGFIKGSKEIVESYTVKDDGYIYVNCSSTYEYGVEMTDRYYGVSHIDIKGIYTSIPDDLKAGDVYFNNGWKRVFTDYRERGEFTKRFTFIYENELYIADNNTYYKCLSGDDVPTAGSNNLVKSGGVYNKFVDFMLDLSSEIISYTTGKYNLRSSGVFGTDNTYSHGVLSVNAGDKLIIENYDEETDTVRYCFATSDEVVSGGDIPLVGGTSVVVINHQTKIAVIAPADCYLLWNCEPQYKSRIYKFSSSVKPVECSTFTYTENKLGKPERAVIQSTDPSRYVITHSDPRRNIYQLIGYTGNIHITVDSGYLFTIVGAKTSSTTKGGQLKRNLSEYSGYVASDLYAFYIEVRREDNETIGELENSGLRITLDGLPLHGFSLEYENEPTGVSSIPSEDLLTGWLTTSRIYQYYDDIVSQSGIPIEVEDFSTYVDDKPTELSDYPFKVYHIRPLYKCKNPMSSAPTIVLTSGNHGAEMDGVYNLATLFYSLAKTYNNSMYDKLRMCDIYILPCVNPSGIDSHSRANFRNVNINRNMCVTGIPFVEGSDSYGRDSSYNNNSGAFSEYEAKIVKTLCDMVTPDVLIDYHSFPSGFGDGTQMWYNCDFSDIKILGNLVNVATKVFSNFKNSFESDLPDIMPSTFARIETSPITQSIAFYAHEHGGVGMTVECSGVFDWDNGSPGAGKPHTIELQRCNADYAIRTLYYVLSKIKPKEGYLDYNYHGVSIVGGKIVANGH